MEKEKYFAFFEKIFNTSESSTGSHWWFTLPTLFFIVSYIITNICISYGYNANGDLFLLIGLGSIVIVFFLALLITKAKYKLKDKDKVKPLNSG